MPLASYGTSPCQGGALATNRSRGGRSHFDIYRTEQLYLTSALFGGGDWHWRLTGQTGAIMADCGGYQNQADCLAAVEALRAEAWSATVSTKSDPALEKQEPGNIHDDIYSK
jgi:uncharacterized protein YegP (UPF0339 family)